MLDVVNGRLRAGRVGVTVEQRGGKLYLVATLPPKPGSGKVRPYQQRIALGINANPAGLKRAELEAKRLGLQLAEKSFEWEVKPQDVITTDAIALFKAKYYAERGSNPRTETTWSSTYATWFNKLPVAVLTEELLLEVIKTTEVNTRARQAICLAFRALGRQFGIELDIKRLRGNYSRKQVRPRSLPSDKTIEASVMLFSYDPYRWVYGMMATYALRNHEVFLVDIDYLIETGICEVIEKDGLRSKSSSGKVWPLYPSWVDYFDLQNPRIPKINGKNNREKGSQITKAFKRAEIPFRPYDLRHCWARRAIELGLDSRLAAQQMRHTHQEHTSTYNAWLTEADHDNAWQKIKRRIDDNASANKEDTLA